MKKDFKVTGMTCAACSSRVERVLNKMEGVTKAALYINGTHDGSTPT